MDLVIDANVIFAILIKDSINLDLLFKNEIYLYAPEFLFTEFGEYEKIIGEKTERSEDEFNKLLGILQNKIVIFAREEIEPFLEEAKRICPDKDDAPYFALALKFNIPIWSNDKKLKEQNKIKVYSTQDILNLLSYPPNNNN